MSIKLTDDKLCKITNEVENLSAELNCISILMEYLLDDVEEVDKQLLGAGNKVLAFTTTRTIHVLSYICDQIKNLSNRGYEIYEQL